MLAELTESDARGEIAVIYDEIRRFCAVPYVSSLQRHLATRANWLPWAWAAIRPLFASGVAPRAAWTAAAQVSAPGLPPLSRPALRLLGVDAAGEASIRAVCELFARVSPTNLMFSALLRAQLERSAGEGASAACAARPNTVQAPPPALPDLPALVDLEAVPAALRATLLQLGNEVAGRPFVPGLYRMLGHWPAYLAHIATELGPRFDDALTTRCCDELAARVDAAALDLLPDLPPPPTGSPRPPAGEHAEVLAAMARYRLTSPQMVVFATLLRDALPAPDEAG